jgi:hypothetical protein
MSFNFKSSSYTLNLCIEPTNFINGGIIQGVSKPIKELKRKIAPFSLASYNFYFHFLRPGTKKKFL